jgi:hypothetical protein
MLIDMQASSRLCSTTRIPVYAMQRANACPYFLVYLIIPMLTGSL